MAQTTRLEREGGEEGKEEEEKGEDEEGEADKEEEDKTVSPGEERVAGGGEGSLREKQSHTGAAVVGDKDLFRTLFFFPWKILRKEIRGRIVTHFRQLCPYNRRGVVADYHLHRLCGRSGVGGS